MADWEVEALLEDVRAHLDLDPRYWNKDEGSFIYAGEYIHYQRQPDKYLLCIAGVVHEVERN